MRPLCYSGGDSTASKKVQEVDIEAQVLELLKSEHGPDYLIVIMGFTAGWSGVTMLDYLVQNVESSTGIGKLKANADALKNDVGFLVSNTPTGALVKLLQGLRGEPSVASPPSTQEQALQQLQTYEAKLALACMGAIVAYAVTRPGFLPALMGMAGDIVKDIAAVPIAV